MVAVMTDDAATRAMIVEAARTNAHDHYLSALLAPRRVRDDLVVLAAFEGELDRIVPMVSEAIRGEFRLQWWRDRLSPAALHEASGNPIADAFAAVVDRHGLALDKVQASIDARSATLAPEDFVHSAADLDAYFDASEGAAMARAAKVLAGEAAAREARPFIEAAGRARGIALLAAATARRETGAIGFCEHVARAGLVCSDGGAMVSALAQRARTHLDVARQLLPSQSTPIRLAALPVALVEPYLEGSQDDAEPRPVLPIVRLWRLWRMARMAKL